MLIRHANLITWDTPNYILYNHAILIDEGVIKEIGTDAEMEEKYPIEEAIDAHSQYIIPSAICAHTHFYGAFSRGMQIPQPAPADFPEILRKLWWPLDQSLTLEDVRFSTLVCLIDAIRHGTTTLLDHHASPNAIPGSLDVIAEAVIESGLRASLCYEVTDRGGEKRTKEGIEENIRFISEIGKSWPKDRISASFGLHASLTLSDKTLDLCRSAVGDNIGFHIHVAEHSVDEYDSLHNYGMRVVDRLAKHHILNSKTILVHGVHIDAKEIEIIAENGAWLSHQPRSNMNNGVGLPLVSDMMRMGVRVCLGNDGFSNAMWEEWKACYFSHKLLHRDPRQMGADLIAKMAVYNNRELVKTLFDGLTVGIIRPGAKADLIFVNYAPFTDMNPDNLPWHIVFGFHESMITATIVDGKLLMKDGVFYTLDVERIIAQANQRSREVWSRYQNQF